MTTINNELYKTLEPAHKNSPSTYLTSPTTEIQTVLYTANSLIFQTGLNESITRLTLGFDTADPETVMVTSYDPDGKKIYITRGSNAKVWPINTKVARVFTSTDFSEIRNNFEWSKVNIDVADDSITKLRQDLNPVLSLMNANKYNIFRGKNLGTTITNDQKRAIHTGSFDDLYIGDYWVLNNIVYRIADFNYWSYIGTVINKHVILIPDNPISSNIKMQSSSEEMSNSNYYFNTSLYQLTLQSIRTSITQFFGQSSMVAYRENLPMTQYPDVENITQCTVELMSERQVYGQSILSTEKHIAYGARQYRLFNLRPEFIKSENNNDYWLRDLTKNIDGEGGYYCRVGSSGEPSYAFGGGTSNIRLAIPYSGHISTIG